MLIVQNGCITDTTYSNVVFRKNGEFFTPSTSTAQAVAEECRSKDLPVLAGAAGHEAACWLTGTPAGH